MVKRLIFCFVLTALSAFVLLSQAFSTEQLTPNQIKTIINASLDVMIPESGEMKYIMINQKPDKKDVQYEFHVYIKNKTKTLMEVIYPASQKGRKILNNGDDIWMYLPKSKQTIRLSFKQDLMGGEASNVDVMSLDLLNDYTIALLKTEELNNNECYVFELKAKDKQKAYDRVLYWVKKAGSVPLRREMYTISGTMLKILRYEGFKTVNSREAPTRMIIENALDPAYKTIIEWSNVIKKDNIPDKYFTLEYLKSGR